MSPSATTPGACTFTSASAAPIGRSRSATSCAGCCRRCSPSPPTRRSSIVETAACTRCARRSSPGPSRAAGSTTRSATGPSTPTSSVCSRPPTRSSSPHSSGGAFGPHHRFGTVEVRICDAQTTGDESFGLAGLIDRLRRAGCARLRRGPARAAAARPRDRGEPLACDSLRDRRQADRLRLAPRDRGCGGGRAAARMDRPGPGGAADRRRGERPERGPARPSGPGGGAECRGDLQVGRRRRQTHLRSRARCRATGPLTVGSL